MSEHPRGIITILSTTHAFPPIIAVFSMDAMPQIRTARLLLRPFVDGDVDRVRELAGDARVADTTMLIPHPYGEGMAEAWIATHEASWQLGRALALAITADGEGLVGAIGIRIRPEDSSAEMGYWIGVPYWSRGFATAAARAIVEFAFATLRLEKVEAHHFLRNAASGRVLEKAGMREVEVRAQGVVKNGRPEDLRFLAITRAAWLAQSRAAAS